MVCTTHIVALNARHESGRKVWRDGGTGCQKKLDKLMVARDLASPQVARLFVRLAPVPTRRALLTIDQNTLLSRHKYLHVLDNDSFNMHWNFLNHNALHWYLPFWGCKCVLISSCNMNSQFHRPFTASTVLPIIAELFTETTGTTYVSQTKETKIVSFPPTLVLSAPPHFSWLSLDTWAIQFLRRRREHTQYNSPPTP